MKGNMVRNEGNFTSGKKRHQENAPRTRLWVSNAALLFEKELNAYEGIHKGAMWLHFLLQLTK